MKTTPPGQLANVVNASVTMFFHSVQPIKATARPRRVGLARANGAGAMFESSADFDPPLDLVHLARQCLGDHELEAELLGLFRLQARALTAELTPIRRSSRWNPRQKLLTGFAARRLPLGPGGSPRQRGGSRNWRPPAATSALRKSNATAALLSAVAEAARRNRPDSGLVGKTGKAWDWSRRRWRGSTHRKDDALNALSARRRLLAAALPL